MSPLRPTTPIDPFAWLNYCTGDTPRTPIEQGAPPMASITDELVDAVFPPRPYDPRDQLERLPPPEVVAQPAAESEPPAPPTFAAGDVVRLITGGPLMVVDRLIVGGTNPPRVACVYAAGAPPDDNRESWRRPAPDTREIRIVLLHPAVLRHVERRPSWQEIERDVELRRRGL